MKSRELLFTIALFSAGAASAARVDMDDPRRAVGREDDIRIDAVLLEDTVSPGSVIGVTYQIQNLTEHPIAVAEKLCTASYDADSQTVTVAIGSEVPANGILPKMVTIAPGQKKTFAVGAIFNVISSSIRSPLSQVPRLVQMKVSVLRDLTAFQGLLQKQSESDQAITLTDDQFSHWLEANDSIFLNTVPIRFEWRGKRTGGADAERNTLFGSP